MASNSALVVVALVICSATWSTGFAAELTGVRRALLLGVPIGGPIGGPLGGFAPGFGGFNPFFLPPSVNIADGDSDNVAAGNQNSVTAGESNTVTLAGPPGVGGVAASNSQGVALGSSINQLGVFGPFGVFPPGGALINTNAAAVGNANAVAAGGQFNAADTGVTNVADANAGVAATVADSTSVSIGK